MTNIHNNTDTKSVLLVTGISGYIGSKFFIDYLLNNDSLYVVGIDREVPDFVNDIDLFVHGCLTDLNTHIKLSQSIPKLDYIIHLAAARTDNASFDSYHRDNIEATLRLLGNGLVQSTRKFIHIGSVATIIGEKLIFSPKLSSDDLYRSSKYLQESMINDFCERNSICNVVLSPSAVYSPENRLDTNIGSLKAVAKYLPFIPDIPVRKSLTSLDTFCECISVALLSDINGKHIVIDHPVLTVSETLKREFPTKKIITIPFLKSLLMSFSYFGDLIFFIFKFDPWFKSSRIKKLYQSTDYSNFKD